MKQARILSPNPDDIALAAQAISSGNVVGMPTETVYGLAGDAFNETALQKIFKTKERPTFDPLIIHVPSSMKTLNDLHGAGIVNLKAIDKNDVALIDSLLAAFWPGPLTVVLPKQNTVPDLATSGLPTVAVRMPQHPVAQKLLEASGRPLAAPSANRFGRISPTTATHVQAELGDRIDYIIDGGPCAIGVESTVIALLPQGIPLRFLLLRPGGAAVSAIEAVVGPLARVATTDPRQHASNSKAQVSPGLLASHYAPRKGLTILPQTVSALTTDDVQKLRASFEKTTAPLGLLLISGSPAAGAATLKGLTGHDVICRSLSESGDLNEAARNLFRELRYLDDSEAEILFAEPCVDRNGLGYAIADRLQRASTK